MSKKFIYLIEIKGEWSPLSTLKRAAAEGIQIKELDRDLLLKFPNDADLGREVKKILGYDS
jgi:hypothetical protein